MDECGHLEAEIEEFWCMMECMSEKNEKEYKICYEEAVEHHYDLTNEIKVLAEIMKNNTENYCTQTKTLGTFNGCDKDKITVDTRTVPLEDSPVEYNSMIPPATDMKCHWVNVESDTRNGAYGGQCIKTPTTTTALISHREIEGELSMDMSSASLQSIFDNTAIKSAFRSACEDGLKKHFGASADIKVTSITDAAGNVQDISQMQGKAKVKKSTVSTKVGYKFKLKSTADENHVQVAENNAEAQKQILADVQLEIKTNPTLFSHDNDFDSLSVVVKQVVMEFTAATTTPSAR
jgi:hypothetical protein